MGHRTEIILYIMAGIVGVILFMFTHPSFKWQFRHERVPMQASVDRPEASALRLISSHPLPVTQALAPSGVQTKNEPVETDAGNIIGTQEDLNRAFEKFLISQGLPTESLHREIPSPSASEKKVSSTLSGTGIELDPVIVERLKDDYQIKDARLQKNGEVWIRIDPTNVDKALMNEMMATAAELHGNSATPLKVVVWAGNRPQGINTFFGDPIF